MTPEMRILSVLGMLLSLGFSSATILKDSSELKAEGSYDFVVVGAGPGGSAVANRLTESPDVSVLLVEAGGANNEELNISVPLLCTTLTPNTAWDWNYTTTPQAGLNGRTPPFPRGIGLGGSSAVNCLVYTRGSSENIDEWAELSGDESWGWDALLPYFMKSEKFNLPRDGHNVSGQFLPEFHGTDGVIGVSLPGFPRSIDNRVIQVTEEDPEFPFQIDMNSGDQLGIGWVQALINGGQRSSSAAYLAPEFTSRENLDILLHSQVSRVLQSDNLTFRTLEYKNENGTMSNLTAGKEVILSAGAVNTPHILMHSGIGNSSLLTSLGIPSLIDLPSVGANLTDHIGCAVDWLVNTNKTLDTVWRNETLFNDILQEWKNNKTGLFVDTSENHAAFLRLPENSTIWEKFDDPSSGNNTAHYEFIFQNGLASLTEEGNFLHIPVGMVSPASRGAVTINSSDPFERPLIDPALLSEDVDIAILREAIRSARRFAAAPAWSDWIISPAPSNNATTDEELDDFIRENAVSFFHPVATAAMSPVGADWGVVDPDLKVKGALALRIVDASVAPSLPAAHTTSHVYAIAEKAADIIKAEYGL